MRPQLRLLRLNNSGCTVVSNT